METSSSLHSFGVIGFGNMGCEIAWLLSKLGNPVHIHDISENFLKNGLKKISSFDPNYNKLLRTTLAFQNEDLIIESISEDFMSKRALISTLEKQLKKEAIIATNTSSFSIEKMAASMTCPERFIGMHFFHPPHRMPIVEIIPSRYTSSFTIKKILSLCRKLGKKTIIVKDCPGFLINRIYIRGVYELFQFLEEGVSFELVDQIFMSFGYPIGPFMLFDEVGNDVLLKILVELRSQRDISSTLMEMVENNLLGKKTGKGFYTYGKESNKKKNSLSPKKSTITIRKENELLNRVIFLMINEAAECLKDKIVNSAKNLDRAFNLATEFPLKYGGLLRYADNIGIPFIRKSLENFSNRYGYHFLPSSFLLELEEKGKTFYDFKGERL